MNLIALLEVVVHNCSSSAWEAETGKSGVQSQPGLESDTKQKRNMPDILFTESKMCGREGDRSKEPNMSSQYYFTIQGYIFDRLLFLTQQQYRLSGTIPSSVWATSMPTPAGAFQMDPLHYVFKD